MARSKLGSKRQLPNGKWLARCSGGYRADGSRRTTAHVLETEHEADLWIIAKSVELNRRPDVEAGITVGDLWEAYRIVRLPQLARTTQDSYGQVMRGVVLPSLGDRDATTLSHADIQRMLDGQRRSMAQKARTTLSSVLTWAVRTGMICENVMRRADFTMPIDPAGTDFDVDPFAAIEGARDVWDAVTVIRCFGMIRGLPLEPVWLCCVGAGLRVEEAMALRPVDVRRVKVAGTPVTQLAIHAATTRVEERKATKTRRSMRIVTMLEPFGERYAELVSACAGRDAPVCELSASRQNKAWRSYFDEPPEYHKRMSEGRKVRGRLHGLPYVPLSRMRATHATLMQEAGVLDSLNAAMHGHSERVSRDHYLRALDVDAAMLTSGLLRDSME